MQGEPVDFLLDLHLDQLDPHQRAWMAEQLRKDARLQEQSDHLGTLLRPLDFLSTTVPDDLSDKVLRYVEERRFAVVRAGDIPIESTKTTGRLRFVPGRDLLAVAASLLLIVSLMVPGLSEMRSRSHWAVCSSNMRRVAEGIGTYQAQEPSGTAIPYVKASSKARWLPQGPAEQEFASNSRHLFLLLKTGVGPAPSDFVCPSLADSTPMNHADFAALEDFEHGNNVAYDSMNLAGANPNLRPMAYMAYLSDRNPLFEGGRFHEGLDPDAANSPAHGGRGQQVLTLDGSVSRMKSPLFGLRKDNLWLAGGIRRYAGTETPIRPDDIFLIPGFPKSEPVEHQNP